MDSPHNTPSYNKLYGTSLSLQEYLNAYPTAVPTPPIEIGREVLPEGTWSPMAQTRLTAAAFACFATLGYLSFNAGLDAFPEVSVLSIGSQVFGVLTAIGAIAITVSLLQTDEACPKKRQRDAATIAKEAFCTIAGQHGLDGIIKKDLLATVLPQHHYEDIRQVLYDSFSHLHTAYDRIRSEQQKAVNALTEREHASLRAQSSSAESTVFTSREELSDSLTEAIEMINTTWEKIVSNLKREIELRDSAPSSSGQ